MDDRPTVPDFLVTIDSRGRVPLPRKLLRNAPWWRGGDEVYLYNSFSEPQRVQILDRDSDIVASKTREFLALTNEIDRLKWQRNIYLKKVSLRDRLLLDTDLQNRLGIDSSDDAKVRVCVLERHLEIHASDSPWIDSGNDEQNEAPEDHLPNSPIVTRLHENLAKLIPEAIGWLDDVASVYSLHDPDGLRPPLIEARTRLEAVKDALDKKSNSSENAAKFAIRQLNEIGINAKGDAQGIWISHAQAFDYLTDVYVEIDLLLNRLDSEKVEAPGDEVLAISGELVTTFNRGEQLVGDLVRKLKNPNPLNDPDLVKHLQYDLLVVKEHMEACLIMIRGSRQISEGLIQDSVTLLERFQKKADEVATTLGVPLVIEWLKSMIFGP